MVSSLGRVRQWKQIFCGLNSGSPENPSGMGKKPSQAGGVEKTPKNSCQISQGGRDWLRKITKLPIKQYMNRGNRLFRALCGEMGRLDSVVGRPISSRQAIRSVPVILGLPDRWVASSHQPLKWGVDTWCSVGPYFAYWSAGVPWSSPVILDLRFPPPRPIF